jgi:hypothetical protein
MQTALEMPHCFKKLQWVELDTFYAQTVEASTEIEKMYCGDMVKAVKAVINTAFYEGKTMSLAYILPAHSVVVQAILNMNTPNLRKLYDITLQIEPNKNLKLKDVVSADINPHLLEMTVEKFKYTVELLYYLKEYFLSVFGVALLNVTCFDKTDVLIILSQNSLLCNLCENSPETGSRLFQCVECNVSSICVECIQTQKGQDYLVAHSQTCGYIQQLLRPIVESMNFSHLCHNCYTPLHKRCFKNHFNPEISFQLKKKKKSIVYKKAKCNFQKCKRDLCIACLKKSKK